MTLRATVQNGIVSLPAELAIPDGTEVRIEIIQDDGETRLTESDSFASLGDDAIDMGVSDLAAEHDHYVYGSPKRCPQE